MEQSGVALELVHPAGLGGGLWLSVQGPATATHARAFWERRCAGVVSWRRAQSGATLVATAFLLIALPWAACLSHKYGRWTFSENATLNLLWQVSRDADYVHYHGERPEFGAPLHPTRIVSREPTVYEFNGPVQGTYPPWKNPPTGSWGCGPGSILSGTFGNSPDPPGFSGRGVPGASGSLVLFADRNDSDSLAARWVAEDAAVVCHALQTVWPIALFAVAGLLMFALVMTDGLRYVASFVFLIFVVLVWCVNLSQDTESPIRLGVLSWTVGIVFLVTYPVYLKGWFVSKPASGKPVSTAFRECGLEPGPAVAVIGGPASRCSWARQCRVHIVAEVLVEEAALLQSHGNWLRTMAAFRASGARFVVTLPGVTVPECGGREVANTGFRLLDLKASPSRQVLAPRLTNQVSPSKITGMDLPRNRSQCVRRGQPPHERDHFSVPPSRLKQPHVRHHRRGLDRSC